MKKALALGAVTLALAGCAAGPYYDNGYGYAPSYYDNGYYGGAPVYYYDSGPSFGAGYYYYDNGGHRQWRDGRDNNWNRDNRDNNWRGDRGDGRWNNGTQSTHQLEPGRMESRPAQQVGGSRSFHGESGNEAGSGYSQQ